MIVLNFESVEKYLKEKCNIIVLDETESTNDYLKELARRGESEKTVVIAKRQTKGKGRLGRQFFSYEQGLYMSVLLRPKFSAQKCLLITSAAAVATSDAIDEFSSNESKIKWVNDIFIGDKKVCGILTEGAINSNGGLDFAVLGIGINIFAPKSFPMDIENTAGAVFDEKSEQNDDFVSRFTAKIIDNFFEIYNDFENYSFMEKYKEKSNVIGKNVAVLKDGKPQFCARAVDIDNEARLIVECENGERKVLSSGEVSVKI